MNKCYYRYLQADTKMAVCIQDVHRTQVEAIGSVAVEFSKC